MLLLLCLTTGPTSCETLSPNTHSLQSVNNCNSFSSKPDFNTIQFNLICIALNHRYSLKGLNRPYIYDIPLTLAPQRARKTSLN